MQLINISLLLFFIGYGWKDNKLKVIVTLIILLARTLAKFIAIININKRILEESFIKLK